MKTITPWVVLRYLKRFGLMWTADFCVKYWTASNRFRFSVPGYGCVQFAARKGSSDIRVFNQVILSAPYRLPFDLSPVRLVVDAGANAGYSTVFFANQFPGAKVFAIEPDLANFQTLSDNVQKNANVEVFHGAVWPTKTRLSIQNPDAPKTAIRVSANESVAGSVETITIPEIVARFGEIDVLKLDIEGAELELFQSNTDSWLPSVRCIIVELHDFMRSGCSQVFYRALSSYDFDQFISGENLIVLFSGRQSKGEQDASTAEVACAR